MLKPEMRGGKSGTRQVMKITSHRILRFFVLEDAVEDNGPSVRDERRAAVPRELASLRLASQYHIHKVPYSIGQESLHLQ